MLTSNENRTLIFIPNNANYIEILGHKIDGFESFEAFCEYLNKCDEAIQKQIPKKPKVLDSEYCCRDCHEKIWLTKPKYKRQRYCLNCGQAIDWGDAS